jgi:glucose/mannose-6-phosphate isomerase
VSDMSELDDAALRENLDPDGTLGRIRGLPEQCEEAWEAARELALPEEYHGIDKVVVVGMGGSAIAADVLSALAYDQANVPITVVRGYTLPGWVDGRTLVVGSSHSGGTEETLTAFAQALEGPAKSMVITMGGRLLEMAKERRVPALTYSYAPEPRAAIGHGFMRLLGIMRSLGKLDVKEEDVSAALESMRSLRNKIREDVPESDNAAKQLARRLYGLMPLVIGAEFLGPVARRWRTQFNEYPDTFAMWDELPELNHNLVVGLSHPKQVFEQVRAIFLEHAALSPRVRLRYDATAHLFEQAGIHVDRVAFDDSPRLTAMLTAIYYGDYTSYYLAVLNRVRPMAVTNIDWLKDRLAKA